MSAILKEVYDAFIDAATSEQKATEAAKAMANYDNEFAKMKADLRLLK